MAQSCAQFVCAEIGVGEGDQARGENRGGRGAASDDRFAILKFQLEVRGGVYRGGFDLRDNVLRRGAAISSFDRRIMRSAGTASWSPLT